MLFIRSMNKLKKNYYLKNEIIFNSRILLATLPSGSILPEPKRPLFSYVGVICSITFGIIIGAVLSQNIANFLEENELFVPSDDDDND